MMFSLNNYVLLGFINTTYQHFHTRVFFVKCRKVYIFQNIGKTYLSLGLYYAIFVFHVSLFINTINEFPIKFLVLQLNIAT